jgi:hypothetical protein
MQFIIGFRSGKQKNENLIQRELNRLGRRKHREAKEEQSIFTKSQPPQPKRAVHSLQSHYSKEIECIFSISHCPVFLSCNGIGRKPVTTTQDTSSDSNRPATDKMFAKPYKFTAKPAFYKLLLANHRLFVRFDVYLTSRPATIFQHRRTTYETAQLHYYLR